MSKILQTKEIIKLYEYNYNNLSLDDAIKHFGIKGQKWGIQNGPPYPLSSKISNGKEIIKDAPADSFAQKVHIKEFSVIDNHHKQQQ